MEKFKFSSQLEECPFMSFFQIDLNNVEKFEPCVVGFFFFFFLYFWIVRLTFESVAYAPFSS